MSNYEGVDYFYFLYLGATFAYKEAQLKIVINKLNSAHNAVIEVCISGAYSSKSNNPSFTNCQTVQMGTLTTNSLTFGKSNFSASGDNYYHIRLRSTGAKFGGNFHIQVIEDSASRDITGTNSVCKEYDK